MRLLKLYLAELLYYGYHAAVLAFWLTVIFFGLVLILSAPVYAAYFGLAFIAYLYVIG